MTPNEDEAAAIAAAIQQFVAETSVPANDGQGDGASPWQRAALIEGVGAKASIVDLEGEGGAKWLS
jgi:predicted methyltransferase